MSYSFTETVTVPIPNIETDIAHFSESAYKTNHGLIVEIAAIHEGVTQNFTEYKAAELANALHTWYTPYQKPIIMNHNKESEPVGRIIGAKMAQEDNGTPYVLLQAAVVDPTAMQKVMDRRYITGSIGGRTNEAICSICDTDWAKPKEGLRGLPCAHSRGKIYKGKLATLEMKDITFIEYSFVNVPADSLSGIRSIKTNAEESDDWNHTAKFFVLDLGSESIVECKEGLDGGVDILGEMKKKEATPLYHEIKGAFIQAQISNNNESEKSASAYIGDTTDIDNGSIESSSEENNSMTNEDHVDTTEQEDDILTVLDGLNEDLDAASTDAEESDSDDSGDADEQGSLEEADGDTTESDDQSELDEAEQAQETAEAQDSDDASDTLEEETSNEDETPEVAEDVDASEQADETELTETEVEDEQIVEELKSQVAALQEQNTRLKKALHRGLAERVVDTKISLGLIEAANRSDAVTEHADRTAASLADSLRDLVAMPPAAPKVVKPTEKVEPTALAVEGEDDSEIIGAETTQDEASSLTKFENILVEGLLGRRAL